MTLIEKLSTYEAQIILHNHTKAADRVPEVFHRLPPDQREVWLREMSRATVDLAHVLTTCWPEPGDRRSRARPDDTPGVLMLCPPHSPLTVTDPKTGRVTRVACIRCGDVSLG